jgi:hypothetical protein
LLLDQLRPTSGGQIVPEEDDAVNLQYLPLFAAPIGGLVFLIIGVLVMVFVPNPNDPKKHAPPGE